MTTQMHRLKISLPKAQAHFLRERAWREGISVAEVIRRLLEREEQSALAVTQADIDEALSFMGQIFSYDAHVAQMPGVRRVG